MSDTIQERLRRMKLPPGYNQKALNEAADEIEQLEQALSAMRDKLTETVIEKDKRIEELQDVGTKSIVDLQRAEKRIAELEAALDYALPQITKDQIDAAWELWSKYKDMGARAALAELGIIPCSKCGGTHTVSETEYDSNGYPYPSPAPCSCPNNGWVME